MMTNTTLMHINRNMRNLNSIIRQIETGKRVQRPSDDPIISSRALMFRTGMHENEQFQRNVNQGLAWMNVSETTFDNVNRTLLREMRNLAVQGANGDNNIDNKKAIIRQMESLFNQLGHEMNATFGGNFLFSGFRTDEPPVFTEDNDRTFILTQHFSLSDISRESSWQRLIVPNGLGTYEPVSHDINVLKLAYREITAVPPPHIPGFEVRAMTLADIDAYEPPAFNATGEPVIHFIAETGELVMHRDTAANFPMEGVSVTFHKSGFQAGMINPKVYFTGREITADTSPAGVAALMAALGAEFGGPVDLVYNITQYFSRAAGQPFIDIDGTMFYEFDLRFPMDFDANDPAVNLRPNLPPGSEIVNPSTVRIPAQVFNTTSNVSVTYAVRFGDSPFTVDAGGNPVHIKEYLGVQGVELVNARGQAGASEAIP